ncbi:WAT1-related protein At1g68170-like isoform X2 [Arachis ipaensis]|uniref:WAT1-related protein At1g68170-like isoform X2 n=1 Tax=Arachis ipaensis TaxID=130454 RepID=UPI000A2B1643|nr:WAT1-related protein At1g68170-like isoform X2 [Arachis ipaensis]XP_025650169.1 WAT1-related protein At1g68170 isoform X2 [Arachis hypogaea]XP_025650170.1 WAT1-related protein At1g68170 isoform X2 [Arachis hypogaea]
MATRNWRALHKNNTFLYRKHQQASDRQISPPYLMPMSRVVKPVVVMVIVQIANAWMNVLYKLAVNDGMSLRVAVAYRYIFATAFIAPLAYILERKTRTKMTWTILFQSFLCGLFGGALAQNLQMEALALTSVTFATAISNLIPAITFILSLFFGMEKLNMRKAAGKAKIIGTMTGIGGAMLMTFYKGVEVKMLSFHINLFNQRNGGGSSHGGGGLFLVGAVSSFFFNASYALWLIIQAKMSSAYPYPYSSTALMCLMAALLSVIFTFCVERDLSQWKLGWNVRLFTVAYAGIVVSGVMVAVTSWCLRMKGPLFVSVFSPLMLVVVAFAGSTILDEKLYLGSIIGSLLIVCGLYLVLWGKSKEMVKNELVPMCHQ